LATQEEEQKMNTVKGSESTAENYLAQLNAVEELIDTNSESAEEFADYSQLDKEGLLKAAEELLNSADVKKAQSLLNQVKDALDTLIIAERPAQIKAWIEAGNEAKDFKPGTDSAKSDLGKILQKFKERREQERKRAEEEKLANFKKKNEVLEKIKALTDSEESENSLNSMRELMREWKEIRQVPKEYQDELFAKYRFYIDKFYDNLSLFNELKDLDREKNLELKIGLIKRVEALKGEKDVRKTQITLKKIHEDWRNAGPVRREVSEELWTRFKSISDSVISEIKNQQEEETRRREQNLAVKTLLVEKAETAVALIPSSGKEWSNLGKELESLMEEWKKTGAVPANANQEIWGRFNAARQLFFANRREFFKGLNAGREENLKLKEALCAKAESLQNSEQFNETIEALNKLQEDWKKIGPVPESKNDEVWKRFRAAFDHFYNRKNNWMKQKREDEKIAVSVKEVIIADLEKLLNSDSQEDGFGKLRELQTRWANSGFVSGKTYFNLQKRYKEISDELYNRFRKSNAEMKDTVMKDHYGSLAESPEGKNRLQSEERKVKDRLKKAQEELSTLENNKSFFALSKNAEAVMKQFDANIKKVKEQIERLEKEIKVIRFTRDKNAQ
jgi:hypothetical protein